MLLGAPVLLTQLASWEGSDQLQHREPDSGGAHTKRTLPLPMRGVSFCQPWTWKHLESEEKHQADQQTATSCSRVGGQKLNPVTMENYSGNGEIGKARDVVKLRREDIQESQPEIKRVRFGDNDEEIGAHEKEIPCEEIHEGHTQGDTRILPAGGDIAAVSNSIIHLPTWRLNYSFFVVFDVTLREMRRFNGAVVCVNIIYFFLWQVGKSRNRFRDNGFHCNVTELFKALLS